MLERLAEGQDRLAAEPRHDPALPAMLERLAEGQERLAALASGSSPEDARLARALERLAEGQERLLELGAQKPAAASGDDPEARMRLRSIDVQLGRLVEESASGRDGLIAELRSDLAALTRAIRNLERGDGA
ncbi:hypothetical protein ACDP63_17770 [Paracoccus sp. P2]|uniref:hypothetical protein n=1 Tax=Paracoccus sp. P2 TaxID=3248840 RepID=UPI00391FA287